MGILIVGVERNGNCVAISASIRARLDWRRRWARSVVFDLIHGVNTGVRAIDQPHYEDHDYLSYDVAPWPLLPRVIKEAALPVGREVVFVEMGCGKGKVVMSARQYPFKRIDGIELAANLAEIAVANLAAARFVRNSARVRIIQIDALQYKIPPESCIFLFNNPFGDRIIDVVLTNIARSYMARRRPIFLIFYRANSHRPTIVETLERETKGPVRERASGKLDGRFWFVCELS